MAATDEAPWISTGTSREAETSMTIDRVNTYKVQWFKCAYIVGVIADFEYPDTLINSLVIP